MRALAMILEFAGWAIALGSAVIGLAFSAVFLMGFVGTGGREAGGELGGMLLFTLIGVATGWILTRLGKALRGRENGDGR